MIGVATKALRWWLGQRAMLAERVRRIGESIDLAESMFLRLTNKQEPMSDATKTRILISHDQTISITGTQDQIENAARRFARRSGSCVIITVPVAHYHVRGCGENPRGGYVEEGN